MLQPHARISRRQYLERSACGFGVVALASLLAPGLPAKASSTATSSSAVPQHTPGKPKRLAKAIIFLYMDGGPSQVDTFDYKPALAKYHGQSPAKFFKVEPTQFANNGTILKSPWAFQKRGQSGLWVSDLLPQIAKHADDIAIVHSMTSKFPEHTSANYFLHTGSGLQGRPSWGAWCSYGFGSANQNLPTFLVLNSGLIPPGGLDNFNSGFLPAAHQGSVFRSSNPVLANLSGPERPESRKQKQRKLLRQLDQASWGPAHAPLPADARMSPFPAEVEAAIDHAETAYRMQTAVPELTNLSQETKETKTRYGLDSKFPPMVQFGTQCLLARRLVERGVRFIELTCPNVGQGIDRWDQHNNLKEGHERNARAVDQPIAALLADLKQRGLWDDVLVVWAGEFGRTPFAQGADGRDHNPYGFSIWLAGAGIRPGVAHGQTDEFGYKTVQGKQEIHDLHATMLHLLGVDHTQLTFRFGGRDMRLTDVHGHLIEPILS